MSTSYSFKRLGSKYKRMFLTGFVVTFTLIFLTGEMMKRMNETRTVYVSIPKERSGFTNMNEGEFIVDTPACKIPNIDPMDSSITKFINPYPPISCNFTPSFTHTDGVYLRINRTVLSLYYKTQLKFCEYQAIYRPQEWSDNLFEFNKTVVTFTDDIKVECEFLRVVCFDTYYDLIYSNYHAFIQPKIRKLLKDKNSNQQEHPSLKPNVLIVGIDSVSRLNFIRQMPKTREFLQNTLKAYELKGFNKVADNTLVNLAPMLAGKHLSELNWDEGIDSLPFDAYDFIWKHFKKAGYTTLFGEDAPEISIFNYMKEGFEKAPTDYYLRPYSLALERHLNLWNNNHDCFRDIPESKIVLDWTIDFMREHKSHPYFAFVFLTRLTHEDVNKAGMADILYRDYFESIFKGGLLNNTILLFFSDHGVRFGPLRQTHIGKLEERLPFFYIGIPPEYRNTHFNQLQNLEVNQNMLTTPFDVFETLQDVLYGSSLSIQDTNLPKRGISLFSKIQEGRDCDEAGIEPHWCTCHQSKEVDVINPVIVKAALTVTKYINEKLQVVSDKCEFLSLEDINDALFLWNSTNSPSSGNLGGTQGYLITLMTSPGNSMFEVTVRYIIQEDIVLILGEPSRTNAYGDQGKCIRQHSLQKYCYCRE